MCSPRYGWFRMQDTQWEPSGYQWIPIFPICLQTWDIGASHESFPLKNCRTCRTSEQRRMQPGSTMSESCSRRNTKYFHSQFLHLLWHPHFKNCCCSAAQYLELPCKDLKGSTPRIERAWVVRSPSICTCKPLMAYDRRKEIYFALSTGMYSEWKLEPDYHCNYF